MFSNQLSRWLAGSVASGVVGKVAVDKVVAHFELENPALLAVLPAAIATHFVFPTSYATFSCPNRQKLNEKCTSAGAFDKATILPVNRVLDEKGVPLSKEAYHLIKKDVKHTQQMFPDDPVHKKIRDYRQQSQNQKDIAAAFYKTGEREGALLHSMLACAYNVRAVLCERVSKPFKM